MINNLIIVVIFFPIADGNKYISENDSTENIIHYKIDFTSISIIMGLYSFT